SGLAKFNTKTKTLSYRNHNSDRDPVIEQYAVLTYTSLPFLDSKGRFWILSWPPHLPGLTIRSFNIHTKKEKERAVTLGKMLRYVYFEMDNIKEMRDGSLWFTGNNVFATFDEKEDNFEIF